MNKSRRKELNTLQDRITALRAAFEEAIRPIIDEASSIHGDLESIRDGEQEAFDNLPESVQGGERGQDMESAISEMESALDTLESIGTTPVDEIDTELESAFSSIEEAKGQG